MQDKLIQDADEAARIQASASVQRVQAELQRLGSVQTVQLLKDSARTVAEAAQALEVLPGQIAKSVIFRLKQREQALLVITAGDRRVCLDKVQALVGAAGSANADFVRATTGFAIGGVSPIAHQHPPVVLIDASLARFTVLWAAAGHPRAVFACTAQELQNWWQTPLSDVTLDQ